MTRVSLALLLVVWASGGAHGQSQANQAPPTTPTPTTTTTTTPAPDNGADCPALRAAADAALGRARARVAATDDVARAIDLPSIEMLVEDAETRAHAIVNPARDWGFVRRQLQTARVYADQLAGGTDPYQGVTGVLVKAYRADFDQTLQPYALYLPRGAPPAAGWPMVVALHGAYSDHRLNLRRTFGESNRRGESDQEASRNDVPFPDVPMIVVAPFGRGEFMGFQGLGERDVLHVMADVGRAYAVDPDRVYLTGLSMGGEGSWHIGLRHPDLFAAVVPVCGIIDARPWIGAAAQAFFDPALLSLTTPLAVAENASNQQVVFYHGDADPTVPVAQSRAMAARYRQLGWLGKNVRYVELPGVNHAAWEVAYRDGALFKLLAGITRDPFPPHVIYRTYSLRYNQAYWLRIDGLGQGQGQPLALAEIEGDHAGARFAVRATNVSAFSLLLDPRRVPAEKAIVVTVGGATIYQGPPRPVLRFARAAAAAGNATGIAAGTAAGTAASTGWRVVTDASPVTNAAADRATPDHGSSGLFSRAVARERPHLYVYGSGGRPELAAANRALARALSDWGPGVRARFAVKSDREVTAADLAGLDLVLVGGVRSNELVRRLAPHLPIDDRPDRLVAGALSLGDADRAYRVACPNPLSPGHNVLIYAADTERGLGVFQRFARGNAAAWGPESNLDYLIFDGAGKIRASGVFRDACQIGH